MYSRSSADTEIAGSLLVLRFVPRQIWMQLEYFALSVCTKSC